MHSFLTHRLPFSVSSFSHLPKLGTFSSRSGATPCLSGLGAGLRLLSVSNPGLFLFTQPTMQCSPSLGHTQSAKFSFFRLTTHSVNAGKSHRKQHSYIGGINSCLSESFTMLAWPQWKGHTSVCNMSNEY